MDGASSLSTRGVSMSGPQALLASKPFNSFSTPGVVNHMSVMSGNICGDLRSSVRGVSWVKTDWNWEFRILALPMGSVVT